MKRTRKFKDEVEEWRNIPGYEGHYQASSFGRIKSLDRVVFSNRYGKGGFQSMPKQILIPTLNNKGYCVVGLSNGKSKGIQFQVHQLIAMCFHNHIRCGYKWVINHIDFNKQNNHKDNLEVTTQRKNANHKHLKSTSKYVGVHYAKEAKNKKWRARIYINKKRIHLGSFADEDEAGKAYQKALKELPIKRRRTKFIKYT